MGQKFENGTYECECLDKCLPGEPFFVLRGKDATSRWFVRAWAFVADFLGAPKEKTDSAKAVAKEMDGWQPKKFPG